MGGIGIRIAKKVCEGDSRKGIIVSKGGFVELDHYDYKICICNCNFALRV